MTLTTENTKKTSADFSHYFDFLTKDYGLEMSMESHSITGRDRYVRVLRNQFVQVELAGDQGYFHAEIRRLIDGEPRPYSDEENNIGFEDLAVIITDNHYNHFDFYPVSAGWAKVLDNVAELFKKSKEVFTTDKWVDTRRIEELKDAHCKQGLMLFRINLLPLNQSKHGQTFLLLRSRMANGA